MVRGAVSAVSLIGQLDITCFLAQCWTGSEVRQIIGCVHCRTFLWVLWASLPGRMPYGGWTSFAGLVGIHVKSYRAAFSKDIGQHRRSPTAWQHVLHRRLRLFVPHSGCRASRFSMATSTTLRQSTARHRAKHRVMSHSANLCPASDSIYLILLCGISAPNRFCIIQNGDLSGATDERLAL